jgi:CubicO group peptidase (beta-lactamase class C family)
MRLLRNLAALLGVLVVVALVYLWLRPPALLRVGAAYAAKIVCSNVFIAGRDPDAVLHSDVQAPGVAILRLMQARVDRAHGVVRAGFLGFIGNGVAVARPGKGCTVVPDGHIDLGGAALRPAPVVPELTTPADASWPEGATVSTLPAIDRVLANEELAGPGMRALLVIDHGRIVGERYGDGFDAQSPLLGWSMTKSVTAGLVGMLVKDGSLSLEQTGFWPAVAGDARSAIRLKDLLAMSSGLRFNEGYGAVSDVTRMLYLEPDEAAFARAQPLLYPAGEHWSYSSGTAVILARIVQDAAGSRAPGFVDARLFGPLGMRSALIESDQHGTPIGSSYMYATARDWARYAQFLVQDGVWNGQALLPPGYVSMMATPSKASGGQYGLGQVWIYGTDPDPAHPEANPDAAFGIPTDAFWMLGHDGQSIAVLRSQQLVVVRLGLTPHRERYSPQPLVKAVLEATRVNPAQALPPSP